MTRPVISRLEPLADEAFLGFLARAAAENEMGAVRHLLVELGLPDNGLSQILSEANANIDEVADALQVSRAWLLKVTATPKKTRSARQIRYHGLSLPLHQIICRGRRFSPGALRTSPHNRFSWDVLGVSFDFDTFELLEDTCPHCNLPLKLSGSNALDLCDHCRLDLTQCEARMVRDEDRSPLQLIADLFSDDEMRRQRLRMLLHPQFRDLNPGTLYQLAWCLGRACLSPTNFRHRPLLYPDVLVEGAKIIGDFPNRLREIFGQTSELVVPAFYTRVRQVSARGATPEALSAIDAALHSVRPYQKAGIKARAERMRALGLKGIKETAAQLGIKVSMARTLVDEQALSSKLIRSGARKYDAIHVDNIAALESAMINKIAVTHITGKYGLPQTAVEQLISIDLIRLHPLPLITQIYTGAHANCVKSRISLNDFLPPYPSDLALPTNISPWRRHLHSTECIHARGPECSMPH
jgi:hypothetical protein